MLSRFTAWLEKDDPRVTFYLILVPTLLLVALGLVMVLSSLTVESIGKDVSVLGEFQRQAIAAGLGLLAMIVLRRMQLKHFHLIAWGGLVIVLIMLLLVAFTPLGVEVNGNRNWLRLGPLPQIQPAEIAKPVFALWAGSVVARKSAVIHEFKHLLIPILPVGMVIIGLVMYGSDLGTTLVLSLMLAVALLLAGVPKRWLILGGAAGLLAVGALTALSANRMRRIYAWLGTNCDEPTHPCYQTEQGLNALAAGGWTGLGLGQSRVKWHYLPEAKSDFVFTILGEELGLLGAVFTILLFIILAIGLYRTAVNAEDKFSRVVLGVMLIWIVGQTFINIAMVTRLMPVIGVPLPFISYGGSALIATIGAMGIALNINRRQHTQQLELLQELDDAKKTHT
ncbi:peptidoglycan glycosyltransferase FtsW [Micrococcoides hystricis]|uniref:Probable peptidoglycan glycosyltransferase FtsW n=1 Tax=Micrococcoides hystricis TaxID=1572761 RepID=A0ABV6P8W6_9MICC